MKFGMSDSYPKIIEALQSKKPSSSNAPNIIFKMIIDKHEDPAYLHFELAAQKYPHSVIAYLTRHITTKVSNEGHLHDRK